MSGYGPDPESVKADLHWRSIDKWADPMPGVTVEYLSVAEHDERIIGAIEHGARVDGQRFD